MTTNTANASMTKKTATFKAVSTLLAGSVLAMSSAHAAPEVTVVPSVGSSTTVIENYSDGKTAVITATPNGITMQDGMPFYATQVTSVPVTSQTTNQSSRVDVITVPTSTVTQVLPVTPATQLPVLNTPVTT